VQGLAAGGGQRVEREQQEKLLQLVLVSKILSDILDVKWMPLGRTGSKAALMRRNNEGHSIWAWEEQVEEELVVVVHVAGQHGVQRRLVVLGERGGELGEQLLEHQVVGRLGDGDCRQGLIVQQAQRRDQVGRHEELVVELVPQLQVVQAQARLLGSVQ